MPPRTPVELVHAEWLTPAVRLLRFAPTGGQPFRYEPGQWVNIHLSDSSLAIPEPVMRAYSLASAPGPAGAELLDFAITRVDGGVGSETVCRLPVGATVEVEGPFGIFTLERSVEAPGLLFVATGTGITPIRAMIQHELRGEGQRPVTLLFGCRSKDDVLFRDEFLMLQRAHDRFSYRVTLSQVAGGDGLLEGYVQEHLASSMAELRSTRDMASGQAPHVYVCGLSEMVQDVRRLLKERHGLTRKSIHAEKYD